MRTVFTAMALTMCESIDSKFLSADQGNLELYERKAAIGISVRPPESTCLEHVTAITDPTISNSYLSPPLIPFPKPGQAAVLKSCSREADSPHNPSAVQRLMKRNTLLEIVNA